MRRKIQFVSFNDLESDLASLEISGIVQTTGIWSFYQILEHIDDNLQNSMHGFPVLFPSLIRKTIGKIGLNYLFYKGVMDSGYWNPLTAKYRIEGDERVMLQKLKSTIDEYRKFNGLFALHPVFDQLTKNEWDKLHLMHFSLHLSYCHPDSSVKRKLTKPSFSII
ncbi:MAG: DUF1569 domain-containing protein [Leptospiraceae bacterium]|nr:DUF1569 domain-containing protein [Leptospiraceae bacterium]